MTFFPAREVDVTVLQDRIVGSILGIFIGNALGVGVHWQYDLEKLERERGYVRDYLDPLPGSYHSGTPGAPGRGKLRAGELDQQGVLAKLLLESLAEFQELNQGDFLDRFEATILRDPTMDGTRQGGRYGWTDKSICDIYHCRIQQAKPWPECAAPRSDTPDSIVRAAMIGALYFRTPHELAVQTQTHAKFATLDSSVQAHSVAFATMVAAAVQGIPLTADMKEFLYQQPGRSLPFTSLLASKEVDPDYGIYSEPDSLMWFGSIANGVAEFHHSIQPPHRGVLLYGQFCAFFASVPSAYYCAARFADDFEQAVLCSVNGGGQNTMRTSLVGALVGAKVGRSGIPQRFLEGLQHHKDILDLANQVAHAAVQRTPTGKDDSWYWPTESDMNFTIGQPIPVEHPHLAASASVKKAVSVPLSTSSLSNRFEPMEAILVVAIAILCSISWWFRRSHRHYRGNYQSLEGEASSTRITAQC